MLDVLRRGFVAFILFATCGVVFLRCLPPRDGCTPLATRCTGPVAEICDEQTRWGSYLNCDEVAKQSGGVWVCCPGAAGNAEATCVRANECPGGAK